jgi:hypothetical protein
MNTQIIKDQSGEPVMVLVAYNDWIELEKKLHLSESSEEEDTLNWYAITETSKAVINELIAYTIRERVEESMKAEPDHKHLEEINLFAEELITINDDTKNFTDYKRMQEIIAKYAPLLREINDAA